MAPKIDPAARELMKGCGMIALAAAALVAALLAAAWWLFG
jgi:hypothetical protein